MDAVPSDPDAAAMVRLSGGDDLALNELMHRWQERIVAFLLRMTGEEATAQDLAQESFVRLYQARGGYKPAGSFSAYLFQIAANLARNHHRWRHRHPAESLYDANECPEPSVPRESAPDEALVRAELARAVRRAVRKLPPELREALVLFTYHDLSYEEIAAVGKCTAKAVETRLYRARQILKSELGSLAS